MCEVVITKVQKSCKLHATGNYLLYYSGLRTRICATNMAPEHPVRTTTINFVPVRCIAGTSLKPVSNVVHLYGSNNLVCVLVYSWSGSF